MTETKSSDLKDRVAIVALADHFVMEALIRILSEKGILENSDLKHLAGVAPKTSVGKFISASMQPSVDQAL